ncbi:MULTISPECIES: DUF1836 domain-containing protein [Anaerotruncus]|jgi:hypothetical protein|uniref:DUF1836 domain-containing protein n=1 Tax=Anaerotruncus TaxID=244127 RepID=UPI00083449E1|nr:MULTISPECIES: DUF1836 domain-containing protein [Anaerotruncus]RGX55716.1 DUF1836 domain-containing protein [Anaerotruncus sp. AF02-27]
MKKLENYLEKALDDADLTPARLPGLDLYMDQILTLFDEGLAANKRRPDDKLLTKTMVNNYSKERLILPVKGKKYSRAQLMQLLCILNLKQNLSLADIRVLMQNVSEPADFEAAYSESLRLKEKLREQLPALLLGWIGADGDFSSASHSLAVVLALSSGSNYLRRVCEGIVDGQAETKK